MVLPSGSRVFNFIASRVDIKNKSSSRHQSLSPLLYASTWGIGLGTNVNLIILGVIP